MNIVSSIWDFSLVGKTLALQVRYQEFKSPKFQLSQAYFMKRRNLKDFQKRVFFKKFELMSLQSKLSKRLTRKFFESFYVSQDLKIKNRCTLTARAKGVSSDFRVSRIKTRELALNGLINGLKKVSW